MTPLTATAASLGLLAAGYAIGRYRPVHRALDWAAWQNCGTRPTGLRYATMWMMLSAENLGLLVVHPVQGWHAWQHRNDPPPLRSPAVRINEPCVPDHRVDKET